MAIPRHWQTMNIYSPAGTKVWFLGENGLEEQREKALKVLRTDFPYTVTRTDVYGSYTDIFLAEVPGKFNSVMFTEVAPQPDNQLEEAA